MKRLLTGLVLLGVALRAWADFSGSLFWLYEILISRNIVGLPLGELLTSREAGTGRSSVGVTRHR